MGADQAFVTEKIVFGDIKTSGLSKGYSLVKVGGSLETLLQLLIVFELGQQCFQRFFCHQSNCIWMKL